MVDQGVFSFGNDDAGEVNLPLAVEKPLLDSSPVAVLDVS